MRNRTENGTYPTKWLVPNSKDKEKKGTKYLSRYRERKNSTKPETRNILNPASRDEIFSSQILRNISDQHNPTRRQISEPKKKTIQIPNKASTSSQRKKGEENSHDRKFRVRYETDTEQKNFLSLQTYLLALVAGLCYSFGLRLLKIVIESSRFVWKCTGQIRSHFHKRVKEITNFW